MSNVKRTEQSIASLRCQEKTRQEREKAPLDSQTFVLGSFTIIIGWLSKLLEISTSCVWGICAFQVDERS